MGGTQYGIPPRSIQSLEYMGSELSIVPVTEANRAPTVNDKNYPIDCFWRNIATRELWWLSGFDSTGALWIKLTGGSSGPAIQFPVPVGTSPVVADGSGNVTFTSNAGTITITGGLNTINFDTAGGGTAADSFVTNVGGPAVPTGAGVISILGASTAAAGVPVFTDGVTANTVIVKVQLASEQAASSVTNAGLASFNNAQFDVDANGYVILPGGGGTAATVFDTDSVANVTPAAGIVKVFGQGTVADGALKSGIEVFTDAADTIGVRMLTPYTLGDFAFNATTGGTTRTLTIQNTVDAASSQATQNIAVAGTSSGDVWSQYTVGTTRSFAIGIDNSDANDSLKFTTAAGATVNPSTTAVLPTIGFLGAINPTTGGLEWGPDANGLSTGSLIVYIRKNQNTLTGLVVGNETDDTAAQTRIVASVAGANSASIRCFAPNYATATTASSVSFQGDSGCTNNVYYGSDGPGCQIKFYTTSSTVGNVTNQGEWTYPLQPCFIAYNNTQTSLDKTGDGTAYTVPFNVEIDDRNSDYSTGASTFTAPVTGIYSFNVSVYLVGITSAHTTMMIDLVTTKRTIRTEYSNNITQNRSITLSCEAQLDATNTALVQVTVSGSTKTVGVGGTNTSGGVVMVQFDGKLEC